MKKNRNARSARSARTPTPTPTPTPALARVLRPLWLAAALVRAAVLDAVDDEEEEVVVGLVMRYVLWDLEVETYWMERGR
jgi:hypothetical protein